MNWQWFHRLGSPKWFYEKTGRWITVLAWIAGIALFIGAVWGLGFAPADAKQKDYFRIIYVHVPSSVVAMAGYYVMAIAGAIGLIWRMKLSFMVMKSAAIIGAALTFLSLFTGAVWGIKPWGTWWIWDARITSTFVLFLLYLGIIALQGAYPNRDAADKTSAILGLVGMVNIPIIYKSVDWWLTLHQTATFKLTESSTIDPSMAYPLILMIMAFYVMYTAMLLFFTRIEILERESRSSWVKDIIKQSLK